MKPSITAPADIERESFATITRELGDKILASDIAPIVKRVIHTTADFDYAETLYFSNEVVAQALALLKNGAVLITDTNMVKAGINKTALGKLNGQVHCFIADEDVAAAAAASGVTRAVAAVDKAARLYGDRPTVFAIGNAPTALFRLLELSDERKLSPALVIGVPVGFVHVVESKDLLVESGLPCIVARGRKGGSNVAAAICNALLYLVGGRDA